MRKPVPQPDIEYGSDYFRDLVDRLDLEQKVTLLTGPPDVVHARAAVDRAAEHRDVRRPCRRARCGVGRARPSLPFAFPSPTAVAASWDPDVVRAVGRGLGSEARRKAVDVVLAPTVNLHRTPYGGRHFEAFSEDPDAHHPRWATAYVVEVNPGPTALLRPSSTTSPTTRRPTGSPSTSRWRSGASPRELYLRRLRGSGSRRLEAWAVMSAYNSINGATASENEPVDLATPGRVGL